MPKLSCNWRRRRWARSVLTGLSENRAVFVARDDVAAAAGILIGDGHAGAIYNATGP
jgi:NAD(P)H dehydrogenase (quinone)